jgi:hypothetical protein
MSLNREREHAAPTGLVLFVGPLYKHGVPTALIRRLGRFLIPSAVWKPPLLGKIAVRVYTDR